MEPRVRLWWMAALLLLLIAIAWSARQYLAWHRQTSLVRAGTQLEAVIWQPQDWRAGKPIPNRSIPAGAEAVLVWTVDGNEYDGMTTFGRPVLSGQTAPVWIDPANPARWTANGVVSPLRQELVALIVLVPMLLLSALAAWAMRWRVMRIWTDGEAQRAVVVDSRLSALSPRSRQVRCSLLDVADRRLITVTIPVACGVPAKGESFYLLAPPGQYDKAVAARAFV